MTSFKKRDADKNATQRVQDTESVADSPCVAQQHCSGEYDCVPAEDYSCTAPDYQCGPAYGCTAPDYQCGPAYGCLASYSCSGDYCV